MNKEWNKNDHRDYVGNKNQYDIMGAIQFTTLIRLGLREYHNLLDIGCGSLRAGRLFIPYLLPEKYFGTEPNGWLVDTAINKEVGKDILTIKRPSFNYDGDISFYNHIDKFSYILAHSIFSHASKGQIISYIKEVKKILKKKGIFVFTFCEGKKNNENKEWVYPGKVEYTFSFIKNILNKNNLKCTKIKVKSPGNQTWIKAERIK